ncbi:hypothetical protein F4781DRAFT_189231 [Annulohypoxylon bovei var. microspora]|nr:hypothetical protein F4781DRAFT_189231 [Annulohypoxylon bovei var. microspora]
MSRFAYEDERRRPYGYESYKPTEDRGYSRDYNNGIEHDRSRDRSRDMELGRRDSRDMRDTREPRAPPRSPYPNKKGIMGSPNSLRIDTKVVDEPRRSSSSTQSATSAFNTIPTEPAADRVGKSNTVPGSAVTPIIPRAKDPNVQDVFDVVFKWNNTTQELVLLKLQNEKLLREDQRRQAELSKISSKVDDYAPYLDFKGRFQKSGNAEREYIVKRFAELERRYYEELEQVVCAISSHAPINPQAAVQTVSLSKLEAEFENFQKQASEQQRQASEQQKQIAEAQAQIRNLLCAQENSTKGFVALEKDFRILKFDNSTLKSDYNTLKSDYKTLKTSHDALKIDHDSLKYDHNALKTENSELKQQIADLGSTKDSAKKAQDEADRLSKDFQSFKTRMDDVASKVNGFMEKVEDLDMDTYNEILEAWIDHDFKNKIFSITALRQDLQSFRESTASRLDKNETLVQKTGVGLEIVEKVQQVTPQPTNQTTGEIKLALQAFVEEKLNSLNEIIQKTVADSGDVCADMVDDVRLRIENIETTVNTLSLVLAPSKDPDITTQISALQQTTDQQGQDLRRFENRIESIEGQRLGSRVDHVGIGVVELEKKIRSLQESNAGGGRADTEVLVRNIIKPDIDDAKMRFEALDMALRVLDGRWSNLSSKQMAERIIQQLDPYGQRNEVRVSGIEKEIAQLKSMLSNIDPKLLMLLKDKKFTDIMKASPLDGKRHASSESPSEELMTKKRKLGSNGQYVTEPHRSSSNNL